MPADRLTAETIESEAALRALGEAFDAEGYDAARAERYARREGFY